MSDTSLDRRLAEMAEPEHDPWADAQRLAQVERRIAELSAELDSHRDERVDLWNRLDALDPGAYRVGDHGVLIVSDEGLEVLPVKSLVDVKYGPSPDDVRRHGYTAILPAEACCGECRKGGAA